MIGGDWLGGGWAEAGRARAAEGEEFIGECAGVEGEAELLGELGEDFAERGFAFEVGAEFAFD